MNKYALKIIEISLQALEYACGRARTYARAQVIFAAALLALSAQPVFADSNPLDDSANIEILITPNFDRGVEIDTANVHMNLGNVDLGIATQTVRPATVTIVGNVLNNELNLSAVLTGGWNFDDNVASQETDALQAWVVFKATTSATVPSKSASNFDDANDAITPASPSPAFGATRVGFQNGNGGTADRFEDGVADMDSLAPGTKRHMWMYFRTPPVTSTSNQQQINFTLSVTPGP